MYYQGLFNGEYKILVDANECYFPDACGANLTCQNTDGSYLCRCPLGFAADPGSLNPLNPNCLGEEIIQFV